MEFVNKSLRLAIFGTRGIGLVHARIFKSLGVDVCAVLGSSEETALDAARQLKESFGIEARAFHRQEDLFEETKPGAVSICTPAKYHYDAIVASLDRNIPVFCEKPIFWEEGINRKDIEEKLGVLEKHTKRKIFVNTCSASFMDCVIDAIGSRKNITSFYFKFYSQGPHVRSDIGLDLLPHGLSLLLRLFGPQEIKKLTERVDTHNYKCSFSYAECDVVFDFQELPGGSKDFIIGIDGRTFTRIQEGFGATYRVYLEDSKTGEKIRCKDPFEVYIRRFIKYCQNGLQKEEDSFEEAAANLRLAAEILLGRENK
jgi:predicted dehydrogenase